MNIPSIDSEIEVTVRLRDIYIYAPSPYKNVVFRGKVIKNAKWINADSFSLQTTDVEYPVKIIPAAWVTDIKLISGEVQSIRKFEVSGSKGSYIVTKSGKHYSCTCIGFKFHAKCKHIQSVKEKNYE